MAIGIQYRDLEFMPDRHIYTWKGNIVPSVTQVLGNVAVKNNKDEFIPIADCRWCKNEIAQDFGNKFHDVARLLLLDKNVQILDEMRPWVNQFNRWRKDNAHLQVYCDKDGIPVVEYPLYSIKYGYAGMVDAVFKDVSRSGGVEYLVVVDWKTAVAEMDYWNYQTAGYEKLIQEVFSLHATTKIVRTAVRFEEDTYIPITRDSYKNPEDWIVFQSCLNILNSRKSRT